MNTNRAPAGCRPRYSTDLKGRKRFLLVDTLGLVWGVYVTWGRVAEAERTKRQLTRVRDGLTRWEVVWVDGGYEHRLEAWAAEQCRFRVEVIKRPAGSKDYVSLPNGGWSRGRSPGCGADSY